MKIRVKATLALIILAVVTVGTTSSWQMLSMRHGLKDLASSQAIEEASIIAEDIDARVETLRAAAESHAEILGHLPALDPRSRRQALADFAKTHLFDVSLIVNPAGKAIASLPDDGREGGDFTEREIFTTPARHRRTTVSAPLEGKFSTLPYMAVSVPHFGPDGALQFVYIGYVNLHRDGVIGQIIRRKIGTTGRLALIARDRRLVLVEPTDGNPLKAIKVETQNPLLDHALQGGDSVGEGESGPGQPSALQVYRQIKNAPWTLALSYPSAEIAAPLAKAWLLILLTSGGAILIMAGGFYAFLTHQLRPLEQLRLHIDECGRTGRPPSAVETGDEIGELAQTIRDTILRLSQNTPSAYEGTAQLEAILANTPIGVALVGFDRLVRRANQQFCDVFAVKINDLVGNSVRLLYGSEDDYEKIGRLAYETMREGHIFQQDISMLRSDGKKILAHMRGRMVDPARPDLGVVWSAEDVTKTRAAETAVYDHNKLYEEIFLSGSAVKLLIDPASTTIVDANPAASHFYGYPREVLCGMALEQINPLPRQALAQSMNAVQASEQTITSWCHRDADGELHDVEVYSSAVHIGGRDLMMSIVHDVGDRKLNELRLAEANQQLSSQADELARSNAELEQFAYVASHDLRQPLRQVSSFATLLERRYAEQLDDTAREFMGYIHGGAERMERLVVDLLQYSRIGRISRTKDLTNLSEVIRDALHNLGPAIAESGATIEVALPDALPPIEGDSDELVRLMQNLLGNALKYCAPDRPSVVRVSAENSDGVTTLHVQDNGIGIDPANFEQIFGIFQRLHGPDEYEGTGIGLAICKKIVENHKGHIWVDSAPGEGTTFHVALPKEAVKPLIDMTLDQ